MREAGGFRMGPVRADGPDRPRRQLRGDAERLGGLLPRSALRAVGACSGAGRRRLPRPQDRARVLRLRGGRRRPGAATEAPLPRPGARRGPRRPGPRRGRSPSGWPAAGVAVERARRRLALSRRRHRRRRRGGVARAHRRPHGDGDRAGAPARELVLFDLALDYATATRLAVARADTCGDAAYAAAVGALQAAGVARQPPRRRRRRSLVLRTVAMLANEAADAVAQGVATPAAVDLAMQRASTTRAARWPGPTRSAPIASPRVLGTSPRTTARTATGRRRCSRAAPPPEGDSHG